MANLILGTVQFGLNYGVNNDKGKPDVETVFKILSAAYQSGIRTLDTAEGYGNAEDIIGAFHQKNGKLFEVNTKFTCEKGVSLRTKLETALRKLGVVYIGTYFYHSYKDFISNREVGKELQDLKENKFIRYVGLSVYTNDELQTAINDPAIDVIQMPFNLLDNYNQRGILLQLAKSNNKRVQVRSVFLQGLFFKDINDLPAKLLPLSPYLEKVQSIAGNRSSMEALCLQYAEVQSEIDEIIIGIDNEQQLDNNIDALKYTLSPAAHAEIDLIEVKETALLYPYNWS